MNEGLIRDIKGLLRSIGRLKKDVVRVKDLTLEMGSRLAVAVGILSVLMTRLHRI